MCKLDIIAETPLTPEQHWNNWFFGSLREADFVIMLVIFCALFLMLLSVAVLFAVSFMNSKKKNSSESPQPDGSIHAAAYLCSVIGSMIVVLGILALIGVSILLNQHSTIFYQFLNYDLIFAFAVAASILLLVAIHFSPNAGKGFRRWNRICLIPALLAVGIGLFFYVFHWITMSS